MGARKKNLSSSQENYLETIFHIAQERGAAKPKDIAQRLDVNPSSVTGALRTLAEKGLINYAPYEVVTLTQSGQVQARSVVRRHEALRDFFVKVLMVNDAEADEAACRMEHVVSSDILERFVQFVEYMELCPRGGTEWIEGFGYRCTHGEDLEDCESCLLQCLSDVRIKKNRDAKEGRPRIPLSKMADGDRGKIVRIERPEIIRRTGRKGLQQGALVEVERIATDTAPMSIKVKNHHMELWPDEAADIAIEPV